MSLDNKTCTGECETAKQNLKENGFLSEKKVKCTVINVIVFNREFLSGLG